MTKDSVIKLSVTLSTGLSLEVGFGYNTDEDALLQASRMLGTPEGISAVLTVIVPKELKHLIVEDSDLKEENDERYSD